MIADLCEQYIQLQLKYNRTISRLCADVLAQGEDALLLQLLREGRPMLAGEIVDRLGLTSGRVANIFKRLEEKGLVERLHDEVDRRRVYVTLTEAGAACARERYDVLVACNRAVLESLGEEDARAALRLMEKSLRILQD